MFDLEDKVITLWIITANHDPDQTYVYTDQERALNSIVVSSRAYLDPMQNDNDIDEKMEAVEKLLMDHRGHHVMQFQLFGLSMIMHRLEIDRYNPLHTVLRHAYNILDRVPADDDAVPDGLRGQIAGLFKESLN